MFQGFRDKISQLDSQVNSAGQAAFGRIAGGTTAAGGGGGGGGLFGGLANYNNNMKEMAKPKQEQHAVLVDPKFSTTLNTIPGYKIVKYLGHVRGSAQSYKAVMEACEEQLLASHYDLAIHSLLGHAGALGANAIISVRFDCSANSFAHGTAVVVVPV